MKITDKYKLTITKILGHVPNRAMLLIILSDMKKEGLSVIEAANRYTMPDMIILDDDEDPPPPEWPGQKRIIIRSVSHKDSKK